LPFLLSSLLLLSLLAPILASGARTSVSQVKASTPDHVVISEVGTQGQSGAHDEFVELYNLADSSVEVKTSQTTTIFSLVATGIKASSSTDVAPTSTNSSTDYVNYVKTNEIPSPMPLDSPSWVTVSTSPHLGDYAVAVTNAGENIYIANSTTAQVNYFMCYNTITRSWSSPSNPPLWFKNGNCIAWNRGDNIYALMGASYSDTPSGRVYFYCYSIKNNTWTQLLNTPTSNGAGDALCFVPGSALGVNDDNFLYAILGNKDVTCRFHRYSIKNGTWSTALNFPWSATDDGCSLVWTGGNYLYALRGEWQETTACYDFSRYDLISNSWTSRAPIPAYPHDGGSGGVGDGGSLVWVGGGCSDYIYALSGNQCYPENPAPVWDNRFYLYTISTDSWGRLTDLPAGVGNQNGPRLCFLNENIYCWRGCNKDGSLYAYSVDTIPPTTPSLLSPPNGSTTNDNTPTFDWTDVTDPSGATYTLEIDNDSNMSSPILVKSGLATSEYTLTELEALGNGTWYWHVRAVDGAGNVGVWSSIWQFTIGATPPPAPTLISPPNNSRLGENTPTFRWTVVSDPSGVTYQIQVDNDPSFSSPEVNVTGLANNTYHSPTLAYKTYSWRVRAIDGTGNQSDWSDVWRVTLIPKEEPPPVEPPDPNIPPDWS
jgi:hypothetical protein